MSDVLPEQLHITPSDVQVVTPMNGGALGARELNAKLQRALNPPTKKAREINRYGFCFREGDKIMQLVNDYDKGVYNGETGTIIRIAEGKVDTKPRMYCDFDRQKYVVYDSEELEQLAPAYAITIHKSQGSEFPVVVIPAHMEHKFMLQRNLMYTAITRAKRLVVVVGTESAVQFALNRKSGIGTQRWTCLKERVREEVSKIQNTVFAS